MIKKLLFVLLSFIMFLNVINAEKLEEANEGKWQEELLEGSNVELQYRYLFYKEKKVGEYIEKGLPSQYEFEDENNKIYGNYTSYKLVCDREEGDRINYGKKYEYQELLSIKYIKILNTSDDNLNIDSITIYNGQRKIGYTINLNSNDNKETIALNKNEDIIFKLSENINLGNIKLDLKSQNNKVEYEIIFSNDETFNDTKIVAKTIGNTNKLTYTYDENFIVYENYTKTNIGYNIVVNSFMKILSTQTVCRTAKVKTYRYNIEKIYYDDNYYNDVSELNLTEEEKLKYKKDYGNYKIYYRYNNIENNETKEDSINEELKLVNTGISKPLNYNYLIIYVLFLILLSLILIKKIKKNVDRN